MIFTHLLLLVLFVNVFISQSYKILCSVLTGLGVGSSSFLSYHIFARGRTWNFDSRFTRMKKEKNRYQIDIYLTVGSGKWHFDKKYVKKATQFYMFEFVLFVLVCHWIFYVLSVKSYMKTCWLVCFGVLSFGWMLSTDFLEVFT